MDERSGHWNRVYETGDASQVSWFEAKPKVSLDLIRQSDVSKSGAILDIGAGASRLAGTLICNGFEDVSALDISEAALVEARRQLPEDSPIDWIVADIRHWEPPRRYDLWHDRAAFHFLTDSKDQEAYLESLNRALQPGGHVIIGTFALDGPETCSGLPVQLYNADSLAARVGSGYRLLRSVTWAHETPMGSKQSFQFSLFEKR